jgi:hypothetical protein
MIRGINKKLGADVANALIRKVFEERFGPDSVVQVNCIRNTENI